MHITQTWKDSLHLFRWHSFKQFFLVTIKTILQTWRVLLFPLLVWAGISLFGNFLLETGLVKELCEQYTLLYALCIGYPLMVWCFVVFLIVLAVRPSMRRKDRYYFLRYILRSIYFFLLVAALNALLLFVVPSIPSYNVINVILLLLNIPSPENGLFCTPLVGILSTLFFVTLAPLVVFSTLFLLDSDGSIAQACKSVYRGIRMFFYNYPFCIVNFIIWYILVFQGSAHLMQILWPYVHDTLNTYGWGAQAVVRFACWYIQALLLVIPISFFGNFYVKVLYEQLRIYFPIARKDAQL
jgi:hypothetical protein